MKHVQNLNLHLRRYDWIEFTSLRNKKITRCNKTLVDFYLLIFVSCYIYPMIDLIENSSFYLYNYFFKGKNCSFEFQIHSLLEYESENTRYKNKG